MAGKENSKKSYARMTPERKRQVLHNNWKSRIKRVYGLTEDAFNALLSSQGGRCAICRKPETRSNPQGKGTAKLAVDHCHITGRVRGLLCVKCNSAIGKLGDDPKLIQAALDYVVNRSWLQ